MFRDTTAEDGTVKATYLAPGEYTFKEITAPDGYKINEETFRFQIDENGKVTGDTSIKDEPLDDGEIVIMKTDVDTKAPLAGAKITVYDTENVVVYTGVSDKDGKFTIKGLKVGSYTFVETEAPSGYIRSRQTYKFTITEDGKVEGTTAFTNKKDGTTTTSTPGSPSGSTTLTGSPKTGNIISRV